MNYKKQRKDAKKNLTKVANAFLQDPLATQKELAEKTGLSTGSISNKMKELERLGIISDSNDVLEIARDDLAIVKAGQAITVNWIHNMAQKEADKLAREDINTASVVIRESQKRYSFLMGENSNDDGGEVKDEHRLQADEAIAMYLNKNG